MLNHRCSPAQQFLLPFARKRRVLEPSSDPGVGITLATSRSWNTTSSLGNIQ